MKWKPMETAPKDGRDILVKFDCWDGSCRVVCWHKKKSGYQWCDSWNLKKLHTDPVGWRKIDVRCDEPDCSYCRNEDSYADMDW